MATRRERLRLTELLASLSLATDLGTGQPLGHGLRTSLLAVRLARQMGLDDEEVRSVQQFSLLRFLGCTADSAETARLAGGDDQAFNAAFAPVLNGTQFEALQTVIREVGNGRRLLTRSRLLLAALVDPEEPAAGLAAHCEVATMLARRLGLEGDVITALSAAYERWDGKGHPNGLRGETLPVPVRVGVVARDIDLFTEEGLDAQKILKSRRDMAYDPAVVDAYYSLSTPHPEADWHKVLESEPQPFKYVNDIDSVFEVIADFVDLKSPWTRGHSREVARLAEAAAVEAGLSTPEIAQLRHAGLAHDVGRVGVPNGIWDKPATLSTDEWEQVRLHSYLTDRILSRCPQLATLAALASSHHERLDGSGYHRQSTANQLSTAARLLAAADTLAALRSARPHRPMLDMSAAANLMRRDVDGGRLDSEAVEAVITAAGGEAKHPTTPNPSGLTNREVEVLQHLCRGLTNRQVAEELFISPKTVGRHVENIYSKIGVSTRAGAAVYAMERELLN